MKSQLGAGRPRLASGVSLRTLPIGPAEAFVLSRVDGTSTEAEIIAATGLDAETVLAALRRLASLGAIEDSSSPETSPASMPSTPTVSAPSRLDSSPVLPLDAPSGAYPPEQLEEDVDLSRTRRLCVLELFCRLGELDHYELLGLPREADRHAAKNAYYGMVNLFHPDRYYAKRLGPYKQKLEAIFAKLTEAHETLSRSRARQEYDELLARRGSPSSPPDRIDFLRRLHALIRSEARSGRLPDVPPALKGTGSPPSAQPSAPSAHPVSIRPATPKTNASEDPGERSTRSHEGNPIDSVARGLSPPSRIPPVVISIVDPSPDSRPREHQSIVPNPLGRERPSAPGSNPPARPSHPQAVSPSPEQRAKALARRLRAATGSSAPPPPAKDAVATHVAGVAEELRSEFARRTSLSRLSQAQRHIDAANESAGAGQWMAAANSMRLAAAIAPDEEEVHRKLAEFELRSARALRDTYVERAREAERNGQPTEAATLYEKAARSAPTPSLLLKAAQCLLASNTDLRRAATLAKHSLSLNDAHVEAHVTLAKIYIAAGMGTSAALELERASALAPNDASIKDLLKQLKQNVS